MLTQPIKYVFKATKYFKTTVHYLLESTDIKKPQLTAKLNISESRDFAKSKPIFWVQERGQKKWITPRLTGLFKTDKENVYWGCRGNYEHLILFVFTNSKEDLTVYYFNNFFTRNLQPLIKNL